MTKWLLSTKTPKVRDIVEINGDAPQITWKMGRIVELIERNGGKNRPVRIQFPSKIVLLRFIGNFHSLKCEAVSHE